MMQQPKWASAALGALLLTLGGPGASAQEARPGATDQGRNQSGSGAQPEHGPVRKNGQDGKDAPETDRASPGERPRATDQAPERRQDGAGETDRANDQRPVTDAARGAGPAARLAEVELKHAKDAARIDKLMEVYREKGDQEKVTQLEQMRERANKIHKKHLAGLEREFGPERFKAARATLAEHRGGPSERGLEMRSDRADERSQAGVERPGGETDAARKEAGRAEQARKQAAREGQAGHGQTDRPNERQSEPRDGKPADRPADKPAGKPAGGERGRDGGAS